MINNFFFEIHKYFQVKILLLQQFPKCQTAKWQFINKFEPWKLLLDINFKP
jgi:hypothetical protein